MEEAPPANLTLRALYRAARLDFHRVNLFSPVSRPLTVLKSLVSISFDLNRSA